MSLSGIIGGSLKIACRDGWYFIKYHFLVRISWRVWTACRDSGCLSARCLLCLTATSLKSIPLGNWSGAWREILKVYAHEKRVKRQRRSKLRGSQGIPFWRFSDYFLRTLQWINPKENAVLICLFYLSVEFLTSCNTTSFSLSLLPHLSGRGL